MKIEAVDGRVVFATHLIAFTPPQDYPDNQKSPLHAFRIDPEGIVCFSDQERARAEQVLAVLGLPFTTQAIKFTQTQRDKVAGKIYHSCGEALKHLNGEIDEPESEIIPNLKKALKEFKNMKESKEVTGQLQTRITALEQENTDLKARVAALEAAILV